MTLPDYLRDKPRNIILRCLDRMARSQKLTASNIIDKDQEKGIFEIMKSSGAKYRISFGNHNPESMPSSTCQDWTNWHIPHKHFFIIFKRRAAWQWSNLPPSYFTAHTCQLTLRLWTSILMDLLFSIWMTMMSLMLNWYNSLHKTCKLKYVYMYIIMILCMLKLGWPRERLVLNLCGQTVQTCNCWYCCWCSAGHSSIIGMCYGSLLSFYMFE